MSESTIQTDVPGIINAETIDDEDIFLKKYVEQEPKAEAETEEVEADVEEAEAETEEVEAEAEAEVEETEADDEAVVKVKAGDKELKFKVSDLKRLAGQEAELTRKSQAVAEVTKRATDETEKALSIIDAMIKQTEKQWVDQGFDKVDLNLAAAKYSEDTYRILKADMERLNNQHRFLKEEGNALVERHRAARMEDFRKAESTIDATIARDVPGWTKATRDEVVTYAKAQGLASADAVVDAGALKLMHKAMQFDKGQAAVKAKVKPTAVSAPKNSLKPGSSNNGSKPDAQKQAMSALRKSGSIEDAQQAFLARFGG